MMKPALPGLFLGLGVIFNMGATGLVCPATSVPKTPTPIPTPSATPGPVKLLSLTNNGAAVAANAGIFGGTIKQTFVVTIVDKTITGQFSTTSGVDLAYTVLDPNAKEVVRAGTTGAVLATSFTFTPVIAGVYVLNTTAAAEIPAGVYVTLTITQ